MLVQWCKQTMKNRSEGAMIKAYQTLWTRLTASRTVKPKTHILDNEASTEFKKEIQKNCTIQLVPPDNHRRNLAERAIQTFKSHFKSILAGVDDSFPMRLWDRLLPQAVLTLNLQGTCIQGYRHLENIGIVFRIESKNKKANR